MFVCACLDLGFKFCSVAGGNSDSNGNNVRKGGCGNSGSCSYCGLRLY